LSSHFPMNLPFRLTLALLLIAAAATAGLAWFLTVWAVDLPYLDMVDILIPTLVDRDPRAAFLFQHGPIYQGVGGAILYGLLPLVGYDLRVESFAILGALLAGTLIWLAVRHRLHGKWRGVDLLFPLCLIAPHAIETLVVAPNLSHSALPLTFMMMAALVLTWTDGDRRILGLAVVAGFSLLTGFGLVNAVVLWGIVAIESLRNWNAGAGSRRAILLALVFFVSALACFFADYQNATHDGEGLMPEPDLLQLPAFVALGLASGAGFSRGNPLTWPIGILLALALVTVAVLTWSRILRGGLERTSPHLRIAAYFTGSTLAFLLLSGYGRVGFGLEMAFASRYVLLIIPGLLGVWLWAEPFLSERRIGRVVLTIGLLLLAYGQWSWAWRAWPTLEALRDAKETWRSAFLETGSFAAATDRTGIYVYFAETDRCRQVFDEWEKRRGEHWRND